jgi:hypothetical protein
LTLWAVAVPRHQAARLTLDVSDIVSPGRLITVKVQGAPANTEAAFFDLGPRIHGLQLFPAGEGSWEGSFAVLPSMIGQQFEPTAHLYDADRKPIAISSGGLSVQVASAKEPQPGMIAATSDGRAAVAFDDKIRLDTIEICTTDHKGMVQPELRNNYVVLPRTIDPQEIVSASALNLQGQRVVVAGPASTSMALNLR